jgi:PAS domain S-box-containing protein
MPFPELNISGIKSPGEAVKPTMKKRLAIFLSIVLFLLLAEGICIITVMESTSSRLQRLIKLHQVEIMRKHLLIQIHKVKSDFLLMDGVFASPHEVVATNVSNLQTVFTSCADCHHRPVVQERIDRLLNEIDAVRGNLQQFLTTRAMEQRSMVREIAYQLLEHLEIQVNNMIHTASAKLSTESNDAMEDINQTKKILYVIVVLTPFMAGILLIFFIRSIAQPVEVLHDAARKLNSGELDYPIEGLDHEFGEVAASFNQMSDSLKEKIILLEESEKRYRMLFDKAGDAIFILEAEGNQLGKITAANQTAAEMYGYTREEMLQLNIADLDTPGADRHTYEWIRHILAGQWAEEKIDHRRKDGSVFPVEIRAGLIEVENHNYILAFDRDMTAHRQMEDKLRKSEQEWFDTFNAITDIITLHDTNFNILKANTAAREVLDLPSLMDVQAKCYHSYHGRQAPPDSCSSCQSLKSGKPGSFDVYEPHLGKAMEIRSIPRFNAEGQMIGALHISKDISERKRMEENLQRAHQMKLVGEWATALAHEIKNPLAGIKVSVEVLAEELEAEEDRAVVKKAIQEIGRIKMLLKSLLNFAKPPKPQLSVTDINALLEKSLDFSLKRPKHGSTGSAKIGCMKNLDPELSLVCVDPMQFQQIFLNLILNALEAMPKGGQIHVATRQHPNERSISVEISDSGKGIERNDLDKIFQPFFTTKKKGTGLGLAISKRLVEQHDGQITVISEPGQGTTFSITLPIKERAPA